MAKFYGTVGYVETVESEMYPGVYVEKATEYEYYGDIVKNNLRRINGEHLNDDLVINNSVSIVADAYAFRHCSAIRYVRFYMNGPWSWDPFEEEESDKKPPAWKVTSVDIQPPRIILNLGEVYNEQYDESEG